MDFKVSEYSKLNRKILETESDSQAEELPAVLAARFSDASTTRLAVSAVPIVTDCSVHCLHLPKNLGLL